MSTLNVVVDDVPKSMEGGSATSEEQPRKSVFDRLSSGPVDERLNFPVGLQSKLDFAKAIGSNNSEVLKFFHWRTKLNPVFEFLRSWRKR